MLKTCPCDTQGQVHYSVFSFLEQVKLQLEQSQQQLLLPCFFLITLRTTTPTTTITENTITAISQNIVTPYFFRLLFCLSLQVIIATITKPATANQINAVHHQESTV